MASSSSSRTRVYRYTHIPLYTRKRHDSPARSITFDLSYTCERQHQQRGRIDIIGPRETAAAAVAAAAAAINRRMTKDSAAMCACANKREGRGSSSRAAAAAAAAHLYIRERGREKMGGDR